MILRRRAARYRDADRTRTFCEDESFINPGERERVRHQFGERVAGVVARQESHRGRQVIGGVIVDAAKRQASPDDRFG